MTNQDLKMVIVEIVQISIVIFNKNELHLFEHIDRGKITHEYIGKYFG